MGRKFPCRLSTTESWPGPPTLLSPAVATRQSLRAHRPPGALFLEGSQMKYAGARLNGENGTLRIPTSSVHGCLTVLALQMSVPGHLGNKYRTGQITQGPLKA